MVLLKRIFRILSYTLLILLAFAVGAVAVLTLTERGRDNLAGIISDLASSPGQTVKIGGIAGIWSGALTVDHVVLEDADGAWLAVRGIEVDWSPGALLSSTLRADRIYAKRIELARLPKSEKKSSAESGGVSLPLSLRLAQINLPDIALGPELAGGVAAVAAKGSVRAEASPLQVESELTVTRTDGRAGNVDASVQFAPANNRIDVDIRASEPSAGILANLLKLPGEPAVDVLVSGSGPAANWRGSGTFAVDGAVITRLEGRHQFTPQGSKIEVKGDGQFESFVPVMLRPLLAGKTVFEIAGTATSAGGVDIERATIEGGSLRGSASGVIDPKGATDFALDFSAAGTGVPLSFGTSESPIDMVVQSASVRAVGDGRQPKLDIATSLSKVETNTAKLDDVNLTLHSDSFDIRSRLGPVTGNLTTTRLTLDNPTIAPLVAGKIHAGFSGTLGEDSLEIEKGSFGSDAISGALNGNVSLADGSIRLDLKADVLSAALPAAIRPVLAEKLAISGSIVRDTEGHVSADPFAMSSGSLSASGKIRSENDLIDTEIVGKLGDVGLLAKDASGAVDFALTAKGALAAPDVSLTVTSDRIEAAAREIAGLKLFATGRADLENPVADVSLSGTVAGEALEGKAVLRTSAGKREIKGLSLALGQNRISGDLVLDENFVPLGTIGFEIPDIGPLAALALETAEGNLNGSIHFALNGETPEATLDARTAAISRGDVSAKDVVIGAVIADYLSAPAISGKVRAVTVTSGTTIVRDIDVTLARDGAWTGFDGGATVSDIPATAKGRVRIADGKTVIELASGQATVRGIKALVAHASTIEIAGGTTTLDKLALNLGGGSVMVSGTAGGALNLNATLSAVPGSIANNFAPGLDAAGTISGTAKITGPASAPAVGYSIDWKGAQTSQTRSAGFDAMSIVSSGDFARDKLTFTANVGDGSGLGLKGGGTVHTSGSRALALDFAGSVPFSFLTQRLAAQGLSLTGSANVSLQIQGSTSAPVVGGSVRASGARFVDAGSGIAINDINAEISLGGGVARLSRLTGTLSTGGNVSASGTVGIEPARGFPADLTVKIVDGRYTDGHVVTANLSGELSIKGPLASAPRLSGTINLARTVITVPERLPSSLARLDVRHKNAPAAVRAQERALRPAERSSGGSGGLMLDVTVNATNQIFVVGRGLDAELGGSLRLTGSASSPQAIGQFTLRRGRLSVLGKRLEFTSGTISFSGSMIPYLDLTAESTAGDATVVVTVTGPANNPKFDFSSIPALPEDEVLARLIFGRSMSRLSPLQIAQLAEAAAQFAGVGGSTSLLEKLRSNLGVDDLDVRTDDQGRTSIAAGKYLNDRTYLTIEKGDKAGSGKATIDLNVGRGVKLRGQATDDGEARGGIFFEREY